MHRLRFGARASAVEQYWLTKILTRDTGTPLIRIGFPIFDRHHHHRYPVWGYQGALNVLVWILDTIFAEIDKITNVPSKTDYTFDIIR